MPRHPLHDLIEHLSLVRYGDSMLCTNSPKSTRIKIHVLTHTHPVRSLEKV